MKIRRHQGLSTLGAIVLAAVILIGVAGLVIIYTARGQSRRDHTRQQHLQTIGLAEEYYFDRHRAYGDQSDLERDGLLPPNIIDPDTGQNYTIYRNNLNDEWCAWAKSEANRSTYFTAHEAGPGIQTNQPINLATCKSS